MNYYKDKGGSYAWRVNGTSFASIKIDGSLIEWTQAWNDWKIEAGDYLIPTLFLLLKGLPE